MFKGRVRCGLGVDWLPILAGMVLVHGFLMIWCFTILHNRMQIGIMNLDAKIAGAIKSVITESMDNFGPQEPPNPLVQMFLAQMAQKTESIPAMEILRGKDGKYT